MAPVGGRLYTLVRNPCVCVCAYSETIPTKLDNKDRSTSQWRRQDFPFPRASHRRTESARTHTKLSSQSFPNAVNEHEKPLPRGPSLVFPHPSKIRTGGENSGGACAPSPSGDAPAQPRRAYGGGKPKLEPGCGVDAR